MRIFELFQKHHKYNQVDDNYYVFNTDKGHRYAVAFDEISIPVGFQLQKAVITGFALTDDKGDLADVIMHTGDAFTVFSTVGKIVQDYMSKSPLEYLVFGGKINEPSRIKLYETFIKYLPKFMPDWKLDYTSDNLQDSGIRNWVLKRKKAS